MEPAYADEKQDRADKVQQLLERWGQMQRSDGIVKDGDDNPNHHPLLRPEFLSSHNHKHRSNANDVCQKQIIAGRPNGKEGQGQQDRCSGSRETRDGRLHQILSAGDLSTEFNHASHRKLARSYPTRPTVVNQPRLGVVQVLGFRITKRLLEALGLDSCFRGNDYYDDDFPRTVIPGQAQRHPESSPVATSNKG
jgi:hypothetical protein